MSAKDVSIEQDQVPFSNQEKVKTRFKELKFGVSRGLNSYLKNIQTSWVGRMVYNRDAATDDRLERQGQFSSEVVRPNQDELGVFDNFSESSWSHKRRKYFRETWNHFKERVDRVFLDPVNNTQEKAQKALDEVRKDIFKEFHKQFDAFLGKYAKEYRYDKEKMIAAGSGGDAINFLRDLLAGKDAISVTSSENGSLVYNILKRKIMGADGKEEKIVDPKIFLRDEEGKRIPDDVVYQQYVDAITKNKATFVSLTMISKTGLRYDVADGTAANGETRSVAERVIAFVNEYNAKQPDVHKKVKVVLDYIQSAGREDFEIAQQFDQEECVAASVITTSKGVGAIPHFSITKMSEFGEQALADQIQQNPGTEYWQKIVVDNQVVHAPMLQKHGLKGLNLEQDAMTAMRGADGFNALVEFLDKYSPSREEVAGGLAETYDELFAALGFEKLPDNQVSQLLAYKIPEKITPEAFGDYFPHISAERGIAWGGALSENGWTALRGSISNDLIDYFMYAVDEQDQKQRLRLFKEDLYGPEGRKALKKYPQWIEDKVTEMTASYIAAPPAQKRAEANEIVNFFKENWSQKGVGKSKLEVFAWAVVEARVMAQVLVNLN